MRSMLALMPVSLALSAALTVAGCSTPGHAPPTFPSAADLTVSEKPKPTVEMMTSGAASAEFNSEIERQRDALAGQVARLCRWFDGNGMPGLSCPKR